MRSLKLLAFIVLLVACTSRVSAQTQRFYPDDPLRAEPAPVPVADINARALSEVLEQVKNSLRTTGERHPANGVIPARAVNTLGEVMDSEWYVNRHGTRRMTLDELRRATGRLARGTLATRVTPRGSREVADLGRDFNTMAEAIERQEGLRRQLMHDVAHELRTPLTSLQCRLESVIDGMTPDPARAVRELHDEVRHLTRLVDDLQDVALAEARELALDVREIGAAQVVTSAIAGAGLGDDPRMKTEVPPALTVRADGVRLRQVLLNLLTNAARHTPAGGTIVVTAARDQDDVVVTVRNTGSRLSDDEAARVFDRFYRTDPSRQRTTGGSGIGLAIVKHLVEAHGGRVTVSSYDEGVTFVVALPGEVRLKPDTTGQP